MTRQNNENIISKKLITAKEAMKYIGIGKYQNFKALVDRGDIGYKKVGRTKYFTFQELDRWLARPDYLTASINEATSITPTSRLLKKEKEYSLEKLLAEHRLKKRSDTVLREPLNFKKRQKDKYLESCPA